MCSSDLAEDDVRVEPLQELVEPAPGARVREQVAGDADEIRPALAHPLHRLRDRACPPRGRPQVEVGEMGDAEPGQRGRQPVDRDLADPRPQPAGFEPAPGERRGREREQDPEKGQAGCPPESSGL